MTPEDAIPSEDAEPDAPAHDDAGHWQRWRTLGDRQARDALARENLPFVRIIAARVYAGRQTDEIGFDEYLQLGSVGLMEAIDRYEPAQAASFRTYAAHRIRGAILNGLSTLTERQRQIDVRSRIRRERLESLRMREDDRSSSDASGTGSLDQDQLRANALFRSLAEVGVGVALTILLEDSGLVAASERVGPERYFRNAELAQLRQRLKDAMTRLPERERTILALHYEQEIPFTEIADRMALTKGRIAQLHRRALEQLRTSLQAGGWQESWL